MDSRSWKSSCYFSRDTNLNGEEVYSGWFNNCPLIQKYIVVERKIKIYGTDCRIRKRIRV